MIGRFIIILSFLPGLVWWDPPTGIDLNLSGLKAFQKLSHPFGCDILGRDVYAMYSYGILSSIVLALPSRILTIAFSLFLFLITILLGRYVQYALDQISMIFLSIPSMLIALLVVSGLGDSFYVVPLAVVLSDWASCYESLKAKIQELKESPYVFISKTMGASQFFIFYYHILPGLLSLLKYLFITGFPTVIMVLSLYSFLGVDMGGSFFGPGLGEQVAFSSDYYDKNPWSVIIPVLGIILLMVGVKRS